MWFIWVDMIQKWLAGLSFRLVFGMCLISSSAPLSLCLGSTRDEGTFLYFIDDWRYNWCGIVMSTLYVQGERIERKESHVFPVKNNDLFVLIHEMYYKVLANIVWHIPSVKWNKWGLWKGHGFDLSYCSYSSGWRWSSRESSWHEGRHLRTTLTAHTFHGKQQIMEKNVLFSPSQNIEVMFEDYGIRVSSWLRIPNSFVVQSFSFHCPRWLSH